MSAISPPIPLSWIEALFEKMSLNYGAKFADQWRGVDPEALKRHWAEKLGGYGREEIARGVNSLDTRDWPPTMPEFLKLCRPPISPDAAYHEACMQYPLWVEGKEFRFSRLEIFWAAKSIGIFDLRNLRYDQIKGRWAQALEDAARDPIPAPPVALPRQGDIHPDPAKVKEVFERLQSLKPRPMPSGPLARSPNADAEAQRRFEAEVDARDRARQG